MSEVNRLAIWLPNRIEEFRNVVDFVVTDTELRFSLMVPPHRCWLTFLRSNICGYEIETDA